MWRNSRNVRITYTPLPTSSTPGGRGPTHLDDEVSYQSLDKTKSNISTVRGVDKPFATGAASENEGQVGGEGEGEERASLGYDWRGKGWLMIASSRWEILGYGEEAGSEGNSWVVTYFAKTLFTPAGVDFYSRKGQLRPETVEGIKSGPAELGGDVAKLAGEVFEVAWDGERESKV
ncbi:hypothetical protein N0V94_008797 [Neodidymelliopsis sp. IMI 364377]|nr:hypothetical protein N0V94_008797 [Neodidymelliopsis sp. IMI 364377]